MPKYTPQRIQISYDPLKRFECRLDRYTKDHRSRIKKRRMRTQDTPSPVKTLKTIQSPSSPQVELKSTNSFVKKLAKFKLDFSPLVQTAGEMLTPRFLSPKTKTPKIKEEKKEDDYLTPEARKLFEDEEEENFGTKVESPAEQYDSEPEIAGEVLDAFGMDVPKFFRSPSTPRRSANKKPKGIFAFLSPKTKPKQEDERSSPNTFAKTVITQFDGSLTDHIITTYCRK